MEPEAVLRPEPMPMPVYPDKLIMRANGKKMVVRQARGEDVTVILRSMPPCTFFERDYSAIVSAWLYGELRAW